MFDSLAPLMAYFEVDTSLSVRNPGSSEKSFVSYTHATSSGGTDAVIFYLSDYMYLDIIDRDGTFQEPISEVMDMETVAACSEVVEVPGGGEEVERYIKSRTVFEPEPGDYVLRFTLMEGAEGGTFRAAIVYSE